MKTYRNYCISAFLFISVFFLGSCKRIPEGSLVVTKVPDSVDVGRAFQNPDQRFMEGAVLSLVDPVKGKEEILTGDFYSACSPDISWDGAQMAFTAQVKKNDPWQIWMMDMKSHKVHRLFDSPDNCMDPVILPSEKVVFSSRQALFVCKTDGSELNQVTFHPHSNYASSILADGRLLTITRQMFPDTGKQLLMVIRPDGTKGDLFFEGKPGSFICSRPKESENGRIYFLESASSGKKNIISIKYSRPLSSYTNHTRDIEGDIDAVCPYAADKLLISYKETGESSYSVFEFNEETGTVGKKVYASSEMRIADITPVVIHNRPKKLPSEVDMGVKTGLLLCQDINFTGMGTQVAGKVFADRIEILGIDSSMGVVNISPDGSVYLKIVADVPFRMRTLDSKNRVYNTSAWIWLRPNERRACIGCHENKEMAPDNRVPIAIRKAPVIIPVQISGIREKQVELE